jgi:uncharacterized membrane protein YcaP (DUF421 family)
MHYLYIGIELLVGYVALFFLTKLLGKTQITQITAFDFISALILGELVGNSLYNNQLNITEILFAIILWGFLIYTTEWLTQKSRRFRHHMEDTPSIIIKDGRIDYTELKKNHLDLNQLQHLLRSKDIFSIRECAYALLESDGQISVLKKSFYTTVMRKDMDLIPTRTTLPISVIMDGEVLYDNLKILDRNKTWLMQQLQQQGVYSPKEVLFSEWQDGEPLFVQTYHS